MNPSPFDLDQPERYSVWREQKLRQQPPNPASLVVEVANPRALLPGEFAALARLVECCNMAIYHSPDCSEDPLLPQQLANQFGLKQLDTNWLAQEDGLSHIQVNQNAKRGAYIPYTNLPIKWHTDGYYNPPERLIRGMVLHCVRAAMSGGSNQLMDPEMAYLRLRDDNPEHIRALMAPDAMVIPERVDETDGVRAEQAGPVFSVDPASGALHMRYTARTRSIAWKQDPATAAAVAALEQLLQQKQDVYAVQLEPGMGLLCNNVLHDRSGFTDDPAQPRLLYRARYSDRITTP
jgi:alpha-ketoglutarate-dependent taurine dioxygenase